MHVSWTTFADFLEPTERLQAVRAAWQREARPYDPAPLQRISELEHRLNRCFAAPLSDPGALRAAQQEPLAESVIGWLTGRSARDVTVAKLTTDLFDLRISLRPVVRAVIDGDEVTVYLHLGPRPPTDRDIGGAIALIEQHDATVYGQPRKGLFLDVGRGQLHQAGDRFDLAELKHPAHRLRAMVRRFDALADKANIYSYLPPTADIPGWDLSHLDWSRASRVLDVGCGTGRHLARLRSVTSADVAGVDPSAGAVVKARENTHPDHFGFLCAELQHLPFATGSFDVVLAMQMLYNVDELDQGLGEIRRVLRPHGQLLAATNSVRNLDELNRLVEEAARRLTGQEWTGVEVSPVQARFTVENGDTVLRQHFRTVRSRQLEEVLSITRPEVITGYLRSTRAWREPSIPSQLRWDQLIDTTGEIAAEMIAASGSLPVTLRQGVFVGSAPVNAGEET